MMVQTRMASRQIEYPCCGDSHNQGLNNANIFKIKTARNAGFALPRNSSVELERKRVKSKSIKTLRRGPSLSSKPLTLYNPSSELFTFRIPCLFLGGIIFILTKIHVHKALFTRGFLFHTFKHLGSGFQCTLDLT